MASVTIENIAGIESLKQELKKGLNTIALPNSTGKTSFCRGLELLALEEDELRTKPHYLNLFAGYNGKGRVLFQDEQRKYERTITKGARGLVASGDYFIEGNNAWLVSFATPDNRIVMKMLADESLKPEFERLSGSYAFDASIKFYQDEVNETKRRYDVLYGETERELPIALKQIEGLEKQKEGLNAELEKLPSIPKATEETTREHVSIAETAERDVIEKNRLFSEAQRGLRDNAAQLKNASKDRERLGQRIADEWSEVVAEMDEMQEAFKKVLREEGVYRKFDLLRGKGVIEPGPLNTFTVELLRAVGDIERSKEGSDVRPEEGSYTYWEGQLRLTRDALNLIERAPKYVKEFGKCPIDQRPLTEHELSTARTHLGREERRIDNELAALEKDLSLLRKIKERVTRRHEQFDELEESLGRLNDNVSRFERRTKDLELGLTKTKQQLEKAEENFDKAKQDVDKTIAKLLTDRKELTTKINSVESLVKEADQRAKSLQNELKGSTELKVESQEAQNLADLLQRRKEGRLTEWRRDYVKLVNDLFDELDFEGFRIDIDPEEFKVSITREHPRTKTLMTWNLNALSRSEVVTVAVAMLLVAKKLYAPNFPFFVMDELIYSYDPGRLERLRNQAQGLADYVVMTQLIRAQR